MPAAINPPVRSPVPCAGTKIFTMLVLTRRTNGEFDGGEKSSRTKQTAHDRVFIVSHDCGFNNLRISPAVAKFVPLALQL